MKQVTKCYGCNKITRVFGSFHAEIGETIVITNEYGNPESKNIKKKIVLCRRCALEAGYKVKPPYEIVAGELHDPNNPFRNKLK